MESRKFHWDLSKYKSHNGSITESITRPSLRNSTLYSNLLSCSFGSRSNKRASTANLHQETFRNDKATLSVFRILYPANIHVCNTRAAANESLRGETGKFSQGYEMTDSTNSKPSGVRCDMLDRHQNFQQDKWLWQVGRGIRRRGWIREGSFSYLYIRACTSVSTIQ